jgi:replicative DNA helicase
MTSAHITSFANALPFDGQKKRISSEMSKIECFPETYEAEKALLGALLIDNELISNVSDYLQPDHFTNTVHGRIYDSILKLHMRGVIADQITLRDYLARDQILDSVGGIDYLVDLINHVLLLSGINEYGRIIYDAYLRRQLIHIAHEIIDKARGGPDMDAVSQIEHSERLLYTLATKGKGTERSVMSFASALTKSIEMAEGAFKRKSHIVGVTSGLFDLDQWLGGLHPSDLLILAGRPSMGKTALATNIAFNAAKAFLKNPEEGGRVLFFSLEMSAEQLATRILSTETEISSNNIRKGAITASDFERFVEVSRDLSQVPLYIDDTPGLNIANLRNRARRLKRQSGLDLIVVDYLQLLEGTNKESRVQEISEITRALKGIAKELNVPVLALSQLSRAVELRDDKRPQLSDLRESGSIEQDADVVMFVYREEYYLARQEPSDMNKHPEWLKRISEVTRKAEVIISKQRHGPIGTVRLYFDGEFTRFGNLDVQMNSD